MAAPATGTTPAPSRDGVVMRYVVSPWLLLESALATFAGAYLLLFVVEAALRFGLPFALDPTEPAALNEVERVLRGQPLYVSATVAYVPLIYGPVYFYLCALFATVLGPTYTALRVVSFLASVGSIGLVFSLVARETGSARYGLVAAGFLAACAPLMDAVLDLGRVDAVYVFLALAGAYVARTADGRGREWLPPVFSGALFGLATLAKVPSAALPVALGVGAYLVYRVRIRSVGFFIALFALPALIMLLLSLQSGSWPVWYVLALPLRHAPGRDLVGRFWWSDVLPHATLPLVVGPLFLVGAAVRRQRGRLVFLGLLLASLIAVSWASRMNGGGAPNVLLPAFVALAILLGLGLDEAVRLLSAAPRGRVAYQAYALVLGAVQLALLLYNPRTIVPLRADRLADDKLQSALASVPGPIFAPDFAGYLPAAQRQTQPLLTAAAELWGLYGGGPTAEGDRWQAEVADSLRNHSFHSVLLRIDDAFLKDEVISAGYIDKGPLIPQDDEFYNWRTPRTPQPELYVSPDL